MTFCDRVWEVWNLNLTREWTAKLGSLVAPILAKTTSRGEFIIALSGPLTSGHPVDQAITRYRDKDGVIPVIVENELVVRGNLPFVTNTVRQAIKV